jgi:hypothetical protein
MRQPCYERSLLFVTTGWLAHCLKKGGFAYESLRACMEMLGGRGSIPVLRRQTRLRGLAGQSPQGDFAFQNGVETPFKGLPYTL